MLICKHLVVKCKDLLLFFVIDDGKSANLLGFGLLDNRRDLNTSLSTAG